MESTVALRRYAALLIALAPCRPTYAAAQFTQPVRKGDLIRMLTSGTPPKTEIAALIRKNCLAFRATERDRADLNAAGADAAILDAVAGCSTGGELHANLPDRVPTTPGSEASVTLQRLRGAGPQPPLAPVFPGSGAPSGQADDRRAGTSEGGCSSC